MGVLEKSAICDYGLNSTPLLLNWEELEKFESRSTKAGPLDLCLSRSMTSGILRDGGSI